MTRDDMILAIKIAPVALLGLIGLWAFLGLVYAVLG